MAEGDPQIGYQTPAAHDAEQSIDSQLSLTKVQYQSIKERQKLTETRFKIKKYAQVGFSCLAFTLFIIIFWNSGLDKNQTAEKIEDLHLNAKQQNEVISESLKQGFNLWDLNKDQKLSLLSRYRQYLLAKGTNNSHSYMNILSDKDAQASQYIQQFQENAQEIKWSEQVLSAEEASRYEKEFNLKVNAKQSKNKAFLQQYKDYQFDTSLVSPTRNITKSQFYKAIKFQQLNKKSIQNDQYRIIYEQQKAELQKRYNLSQYRTELKACVIVPTYNNALNDRYLWNIQSILQQEYSNRKVVIVDDASSDGTSSKIAKHLLWRKANPDQYILIKSKIRNKSLTSFYYGAHKYCDLGEIIYTIDGDDELIGTQVFKVFNAIYQKQKPYTLYSIFIINHPKQLGLGHNHEYPLQIKSGNKYRWDKSHGYSHLRTMLSDTFLLVNSSSFTSNDGRFFQLITDNAVYFCAMQLSCQKVRFLEEINYWYYFNTGNNIQGSMDMKKYYKVVQDVEQKAPYHCIHNYLAKSQQWYQKKK